jgi:hypothetical protein
MAFGGTIPMLAAPTDTVRRPGRSPRHGPGTISTKRISCHCVQVTTLRLHPEGHSYWIGTGGSSGASEPGSPSSSASWRG